MITFDYKLVRKFIPLDVLYLVIYLLSGCALAWALFRERGLATRLWLGLCAASILALCLKNRKR